MFWLVWCSFHHTSESGLALLCLSQRMESCREGQGESHTHEHAVWAKLWFLINTGVLSMHLGFVVVNVYSKLYLLWIAWALSVLTRKASHNKCLWGLLWRTNRPKYSNSALRNISYLRLGHIDKSALADYQWQKDNYTFWSKRDPVQIWSGGL